MKRSAPPARRTPLARTGRLRQRSARRRREDANSGTVLEDFAAEFIGYTCWLCALQPSTQIHHIAGKSNALRHVRTNLFACCQDCHDDIIPIMGVPAVFKLKRLRDPEGFDRDQAAALLRGKNGRRDL